MIAALLLPLLVSPIEKLVLWDGSDSCPGVGWVGGQCKTGKISREKGFYRFSTSDRKVFAEWGWQWAPWKPEFKGTDFRPFKKVTIELRFTGTPLSNDLLLSLRSPGDHHLTKNVALQPKDQELMSGKWRKISVTLEELGSLNGKYEPDKVINLIFGTWFDRDGSFTVDVRRIEVE